MLHRLLEPSRSGLELLDEVALSTEVDTEVCLDRGACVYSRIAVSPLCKAGIDRSNEQVRTLDSSLRLRESLLDRVKRYATPQGGDEEGEDRVRRGWQGMRVGWEQAEVLLERHP